MVFFLKNVIHNSANIGIGSVSADLKESISVIYRIGRFEKGDLSVLIGIGRYKKKLIGRTLHYLEVKVICTCICFYNNLFAHKRSLNEV